MKKSVFILSMIFSFNALAEIASGDDCGTNCRWAISDDGTLSVWAGEDNEGQGSIGIFRKDTTTSPWSSITPWREYANQIKNVEIKEGITDLGRFAFARLSTENPVVVPSSVTSISSNGLSFFYPPEIVIPNTVTSIESGAFQWMGTSKVDIPSSVTQIGSHAFRGTGMTDVVIPDTVLSIADEAFSALNALEHLVIGENTSVGNIFGYETLDLNNLRLFCTADNASSCANALKAVGMADEGIADILKTYSKDANGFYQLDDSLYANATLMAHNAACDDAANCQAILDAASQGEPFMVGGKYYATLDLFANGAACTSRKNCEDILLAASQNAAFKVGSKIYHSLEDFADGHYDKKRIYTVEEANWVAGKRNSVTIIYK